MKSYPEKQKLVKLAPETEYSPTKSVTFRENEALWIALKSMRNWGVSGKPH
jgi:hypothetical protein